MHVGPQDRARVALTNEDMVFRGVSHDSAFEYVSCTNWNIGGKSRKLSEQTRRVEREGCQLSFADKAIEMIWVARIDRW